MVIQKVEGFSDSAKGGNEERMSAALRLPDVSLFLTEAA